MDASASDSGLSLAPNQILSLLRDRMSGKLPMPSAEEQKAARQAELEAKFPPVVIIEETRFAYRLSKPGSDRDVWISRQGVTLNHSMLPLPHARRDDRPDGRRVWYPCVRASFAPWALKKFKANV